MSDYGQHHRQLRQYWQTQLNTGTPIPCSRCGQPVTHTDQWDLDHTDNRTGYLGPAHASCNRAAGANKRNRMYRTRTPKTHSQPRTRNWNPTPDPSRPKTDFFEGN